MLIPSSSTKAPIEIKSVTIRKGGKLILDEVSLQVPFGKVTGVVGPNGAGKSTLLRVFSGIEESQTVTFDPSQIAYLGSDLFTEFPLTARECIELSFSRKWKDEEFRSLGLSEFLDRTLSTLSSGERQRVGFARLLLQNPQCFCLDESFSQLDPEHLSAVQSIILQKRAEGHSFVLISHDWSFLSAVCDEWVFLKSGRVLLQGETDRVLTEENLRKLYPKAETHFWVDAKTNRKRIQFV
jgi:ABC-type Mn2+/Zn2+ transport system ATPase subunit